MSGRDIMCILARRIARVYMHGRVVKPPELKWEITIVWQLGGKHVLHALWYTARPLSVDLSSLEWFLWKIPVAPSESSLFLWVFLCFGLEGALEGIWHWITDSVSFISDLCIIPCDRNHEWIYEWISEPREEIRGIIAILSHLWHLFNRSSLHHLSFFFWMVLIKDRDAKGKGKRCYAWNDTPDLISQSLRDLTWKNLWKKQRSLMLALDRSGIIFHLQSERESLYLLDMNQRPAVCSWITRESTHNASRM